MLSNMLYRLEQRRHLNHQLRLTTLACYHECEESSAVIPEVGSFTGSHRVNVEPSPVSLVKSKSPPSRRLSRLDMASPRPVPRLGESARGPESTCSNSSK